jgi:hypothetical protein
MGDVGLMVGVGKARVGDLALEARAAADRVRARWESEERMEVWISVAVPLLESEGLDGGEKRETGRSVVLGAELSLGLDREVPMGEAVRAPVAHRELVEVAPEARTGAAADLALAGSERQAAIRVDHPPVLVAPRGVLEVAWGRAKVTKAAKAVVALGRAAGPVMGACRNRGESGSAGGAGGSSFR